MLIVFVHGWSVTNTDTYGGLPAALVKNASPKLDLQITHLYLGKYVSFADEVKVDDIARGMQQAIATEVAAESSPRANASPASRTRPARRWCASGSISTIAANSTGARSGTWSCSRRRTTARALAQLGKGRLVADEILSPDGVEPGTGVLDWLELGSDQSWEAQSRLARLRLRGCKGYIPLSSRGRR